MQKTNFNYEILIGEDCSTDNTRKVIETYIEKYPGKIRLLTSEKNVGARKNSNRVFENSKGKYIAECEGDDYWIDPYKLQKQVDYLEGNPDCSLCFHAADIVREPKNSTGMKVKPYYEDKISPMEDIILGGGGFCPTASLIYPRKLMGNLPSFFLTSHVGDYPMQLILASKGYAYYINDCMSVYRTGVKGSWTNRMNSEGNLRRNRIDIHEGDIQILAAFNEYTNFKHFKTIKAVIMEKEFAISIIRGKTKGQKNHQNKEYIDSLSFEKRLKIRFQYNFPKSYIKLAEFKNYIFNKWSFY